MGSNEDARRAHTTARVGVDLAPLAHAASPGVRRAALETWRALARRAGGVHWIPLPAAPGGSSLLWRQWRLPRLARALDLDGVHASVSALPLVARATLVQTVHEVPWRQRDGARANAERRALENGGLAHRLWARTGRAAATVVPSRATARALAAERGSDAGVHVVHWGVGAPFTTVEVGTVEARTVARSAGAARPYVVVCGGARPKKRLDRALRALAACAAARGHDLVVTGAVSRAREEHRQRSGDAVGRARELAHGLGLGARLHFTGALDDRALARLFAGADAHLVVSDSEGFALGVLEAAATGTPSAVATGGAAHEVASLDGATDTCGTFADGDDADDVARALTRVLDVTRAERDGLRASARAWSWDRTAERVAELWCTLVP